MRIKAVFKRAVKVAVCALLAACLAACGAGLAPASGGPQSKALSPASQVPASVPSPPPQSAPSAGSAAQGSSSGTPGASGTSGTSGLDASAEIEVTDWTVHQYSITFAYKTAAGQGTAELAPSYIFLLDSEQVPSVAPTFRQEGGVIYLDIAWETPENSGTDTFMLDENLLLWVYLVEGALVYPTKVTPEQAAVLFPNEELIEYTLSALFCRETLYDVSIYQVWDIPDYDEPDVLLAHYDVYEPDAPFLWQTDIMYHWHLTVEYTDGAGQTRWLLYRVNIGKFSADWRGPLDGPDWQL